MTLLKNSTNLINFGDFLVVITFNKSICNFLQWTRSFSNRSFFIFKINRKQFQHKLSWFSSFNCSSIWKFNFTKFIFCYSRISSNFRVFWNSFLISQSTEFCQWTQLWWFCKWIFKFKFCSIPTEKFWKYNAHHFDELKFSVEYQRSEVPFSFKCFWFYNFSWFKSCWYILSKSFDSRNSINN